ncbi:MAG: cytochrome c [Candidatus Deferrimicrobiaceae bacterium]
MRLRAVVPFLAVLLAVAAVSGCAKKEEPKPAAPIPAVSAVEEGKILFGQKCSVCHGLDRSTALTETREKWASIIQDMQGKKAGWISDEESEKILEYLSSAHGK